ncbi:YidB family protein [Alysiella filiformis]|uniref:DUF937 domain-containing protein n=1 Tax=Alysiella filiformis DSM 16848 TaxID=1120981 RepID=A0A286EGX9_9NEIS|nr:YidB family protein [Alysiella filiformis]QMT32361.1 DUF937 domain-containing protein [Alysiella filiformis]UBQ56719.1 YidB family protein [Alysiella filiformis DSM 16848]SOD70181.1 protein of unknown function [Alysiella filiformis DSM 16848]
MSLLNSLLSTAASSLLSDTDGNGQIQAIELFQKLTQQNGGVGAVLAQLQQSGLDSIVQSWVGNGDNAPVGADQLQNALGGGLAQAAAQMGLDGNQASSLLAQYLPQIVNGLTPNGNAADADGFGMDDIARLAMQFLNK